MISGSVMNLISSMKYHCGWFNVDVDGWILCRLDCRLMDSLEIVCTEEHITVCDIWL